MPHQVHAIVPMLVCLCTAGGPIAGVIGLLVVVVGWTRYHTSRHTGERPFTCGWESGPGKVCGIGFPTVAALNAHVKNHAGGSRAKRAAAAAAVAAAAVPQGVHEEHEEELEAEVVMEGVKKEDVDAADAVCGETV